MKTNSRPARGRQNNNTEIETIEILLVPEIPVCRQKDVEILFGAPEQLTIFECRPALLVCRSHRMAGKQVAQGDGRALVEQNSHRTT